MSDLYVDHPIFPSDSLTSYIYHSSPTFARTIQVARAAQLRTQPRSAWAPRAAVLHLWSGSARNSRATRAPWLCPRRRRWTSSPCATQAPPRRSSSIPELQLARAEGRRRLDEADAIQVGRAHLALFWERAHPWILRDILVRSCSIPATPGAAGVHLCDFMFWA